MNMCQCMYGSIHVFLTQGGGQHLGFLMLSGYLVASVKSKVVVSKKDGYYLQEMVLFQLCRDSNRLPHTEIYTTLSNVIGYARIYIIIITIIKKKYIYLYIHISASVCTFM